MHTLKGPPHEAEKRIRLLVARDTGVRSNRSGIADTRSLPLRRRVQLGDLRGRLATADRQGRARYREALAWAWGLAAVVGSLVGFALVVLGITGAL